MSFDQSEFDIRCEWGESGLRELLPDSRVVVIVDVLSFSTCVKVATSRGAVIFPYSWKDETAPLYARSVNAELVSLKRRSDAFSLSPVSLLSILPGIRLVVPSPNGASLSLQTGTLPTIAGCLRNSAAVARVLQTYGTGITVIPAGERWPDGELRPALEDWLGAGAILRHLSGRRSPEAEGAIALFERFRDDLPTALKQSGSGKELIAKGFEADVELAALLDVSETVPWLCNRAYVSSQGSLLDDRHLNMGDPLVQSLNAGFPIGVINGEQTARDRNLAILLQDFCERVALM